MLDFIFANAYIDLKYSGRIYIEESYSTLKSMINDSKSTITVKVLDFTGLFSDVRTISKSDIVSYGSN